MITNSKLVFELEGKQTVNSVLTAITDKLSEEGFATSKKTVLDGFKAREKQSTTGLADGVAIPHVSSEDITEAKIVVVKLKEPVDWKALDGQPTDLAIAIAVPADGRNDHFDLLTQISGKLADPEFITSFKKASPDEIVKILTNIKPTEAKKTEAKASTKGAIKVVGVTTCVTGVAHTFMAAQALEDEGAKRGWDVKIERQGQMTKSKLTAKEIEEADYVVFGISKSIDGSERFNGKKTWTVEVAEPITKAAKVFDDMLEKATVQQGGPGGSSVKSTGSEGGAKAGIMSHMMAGISFMIPYIAMAGIVLGLTTAFGYSFFGGKEFISVWDDTGTGLGMVTYYYEPAMGLVNQGILDSVADITTLSELQLAIDLESLGIVDAATAEQLGLISYAGSTGFAPSTAFANALNTLAGGGFTLYIPILGLFIANSIAGRKAMAPAAILALVLNTGTAGGFAPFFNYDTMSFLGWGDTSVALGFLGAIAAGYIVGYGVKYFTLATDKVEMAAFQALVPLLIIPIVFTVVPWFLMAFVGYLPLYGVSLGMNWIVTSLIDINMLWLAGGLMGAMICFDLGGPINKIAMAIGVMMLSGATSGAYDYQTAVINGVCAAAVSIPPAVLFFSTATQRFTPLKMDDQDITAGWTASLMGFFGITEGSIPFAAKDAKKWMPSFMIAGFVGGALAACVGVVDQVPMWGGPIIYLAGGYGSIFVDNAANGLWQASNWTWTLLYFIPLVVAGIVGTVTANGLEVVYSKRAAKVANA